MKADELKIGMEFKGKGDLWDGSNIIITAINEGRIHFHCDFNMDSCSPEYFPAVEYPDEWEYVGINADRVEALKPQTLRHIDLIKKSLLKCVC